MSKLTPLDNEYYAKPRSEADKRSLAENGWRDLTKEEVEEFMNYRMSSPDGKRDYVKLCLKLELGEMTLRYYKDFGVCVYLKEFDERIPMGEGPESDSGAVTFKDLQDPTNKKKIY